MAAWAYECQPADPSHDPLLVACHAIDAMPASTRIVRVKVGRDWQCAVVDRTQKVSADAALLREVVASDEIDCPDGVAQPSERGIVEPALSGATSASDAGRVEHAGRSGVSNPPSGRQVQAAAISMQGHRFVVVLVGIDLVRSPGEADMAIADLRPRFGGVDVLLMGQLEDGTPVYHGKPELVELLAQTPVDRMPWKAHPVG